MSAKVEIDVIAHDKTQGVLGGIKSTLGNIFTTAAGFLSAQVFTRIADEVWKFGKTSIEAASGFSESWNKASVVFGDSFSDIEKWAKSAATEIGMSQRQALEAAGTFGNLFDAVGLDAKVIPEFSKEIVNLAADLSSFNNMPMDEALAALRSGLVGETEPLKRFGVLLNETMIKEKAFSMGLISSTKDALTPAQKVQASYALIMEQTANAQGDFARTAGGYANQQRIFAAQIEDSKKKLGDIFLPIITEAMGFINDIGIPVLNKFIGYFGELYKSAKKIDFSKSFGWLSDWWDENGAEIIASGKQMWEALVDGFNKIKETLKPFIAETLEKFKRWFSENGPLIQNFIQKIADVFSNVLVPAIVVVWNVLQPILGGIIEIIMQLATLIMQVATGDWTGAWETIKSIVTTAATAIWAAIIALLDGIAGMMGGSLAEIGAQWTANWYQFVNIVTSVWALIISTVSSAVSSMISTVIGAFTNLWSQVVSLGQAVIGKFKAIGSNIINGLIEGIKSRIASAVEAVTSAIEQIVASAQDALGIASPSKIFRSIGENMMVGMERGIKSMSFAPQMAVVGASRDTIRAGQRQQDVNQRYYIYGASTFNLSKSTVAGITGYR